MKILQQKNKIRIGIALILSVITLVAVYGFGWALSAEQNVLLALSGLPENQKWLISGDFSLILKQLDSPIIFNFSGDLDYGGGKLDSRWQLENETFGRVNLLNLAHDQTGWLVELPAVLEGQLWHLSDGQNKLSQEKVIEWLKELQFQKAGYQSLEREYGGSISCLHLVSSVNILPAHFIEWLSKVSDQDLSPERRQELQTLILKLSGKRPRRGRLPRPSTGLASLRQCWGFRQRSCGRTFLDGQGSGLSALVVLARAIMMVIQGSLAMIPPQLTAMQQV